MRWQYWKGLFSVLVASVLVSATPAAPGEQADQPRPAEPKPKAERLERLYKALDANGDDHISRDEFMDRMPEIMQRLRHSGPGAPGEAPPPRPPRPEPLGPSIPQEAAQRVKEMLERRVNEFLDRHLPEALERRVNELLDRYLPERLERRVNELLDRHLPERLERAPRDTEAFRDRPPGPPEGGPAARYGPNPRHRTWDRWDRGGASAFVPPGPRGPAWERPAGPPRERWNRGPRPGCPWAADRPWADWRDQPQRPWEPGARWAQPPGSGQTGLGAFGAIDADHDGRIQIPELRRAIDLLEQVLTKSEGKDLNPEDWARAMGKLGGQPPRDGPPQDRQAQPHKPQPPKLEEDEPHR